MAVFLYSGLIESVSAANLGANAEIPEKLAIISQNIEDDNSKDEENESDRPLTIAESLLEVCESRGYGEKCAETLLGMAWKESNFKATAVGDGGRAHGFFQIHYRLHRIPVECTRDLTCSANWTIDYLERNGYPRYETWAIQCHNGCAVNNGYAQSVQRHGSRLWAKEMGENGRLVAKIGE
ncbi:hypothetical protein JW899_01900 [Candidatus Uhrbacteria bacterium]|nr:hypothetical protein [Candidatus Uhrbacteria bacterium]